MKQTLIFLIFLLSLIAVFYSCDRFVVISPDKFKDGKQITDDNTNDPIIDPTDDIVDPTDDIIDPTTDIITGLYAFYEFEDQYKDSTTNGRDLLPMNTISVNANGKKGSAAYFSQGSDRLELENFMPINTLNALSFTGWIKRSGTGTLTIFNLSGSTIIQTNQIKSWLYDSGGMKLFGIISNNDTKSITTLSTNTWYHVAIVYYLESNSNPNNYLMKLYLNGELEATKETAISPVSTDGFLTIGSSVGYSNYFYGYMDQLRFYNVALTEDQIKAIMTADSD